MGDTHINLCKNYIFDEEPFFCNDLVGSNKYLLKVVSFNLHGINQGSAFLKSILSEAMVDFVLIQEHWLSENTMYKLTNLAKQNYSCFVTSAMEDRIGSDTLYGRPFGGVGILVNNSLIKNIRCLFQNDRCIVLKFNNLIIINVYMPTRYTIPLVNRDGVDALNSLLSILSDLLDSYKECSVIIGGDFNCHTIYNLNELEFVFKPLDAFRKKCNFVFVENYHKCHLDYTYNHATLDRVSKIDYFLVSGNIACDLVDFHIIDTPLNFSDHLPISIILQIDSTVNCSNSFKVGEIEKKNRVQIFKMGSWRHQQIL